jgi:hypothetical protein
MRVLLLLLFAAWACSPYEDFDQGSKGSDQKTTSPTDKKSTKSPRPLSMPGLPKADPRHRSMFGVFAKVAPVGNDPQLQFDLPELRKALGCNDNDGSLWRPDRLSCSSSASILTSETEPDGLVVESAFRPLQDPSLEAGIARIEGHCILSSSALLLKVVQTSRIPSEPRAKQTFQAVSACTEDGIITWDIPLAVKPAQELSILLSEFSKDPLGQSVIHAPIVRFAQTENTDSIAILRLPAGKVKQVVRIATEMPLKDSSDVIEAANTQRRVALKILPGLNLVLATEKEKEATWFAIWGR